jgi:protein CpxP
MKKLLLACAFVMGISAISFAQGGQRAPSTPEQRVDRLKLAVTGITDDQATKLKAVYAVQMKSTDSLKTASGITPGVMPDRDAMMAFSEKLRPINAAANAKVNAILTSEQAAALKKYNEAQIEAMKQRMQQGMQPGGGN